MSPADGAAVDDDQSRDGTADHAGSDYDRLPYRSVPYQQSQPSHLAAIARLFGLEAPAPESARTLELGCAAGGNIIPLAARFPGASFLGIDLSERQVADANRRIAALGLTNIKIRQGDIATIDLPGERFDYMICHGVYSWIPPEAQDAVFRITAATLADNGVAYVSYNTYPGWHLRNIVRDICLHHAGSEGDPQVRVARARWMLEKLASQSAEQTPYGQMLRSEARLNARLPDSYILGEFLATHNAPCYFNEFIERAGRFGLRFVSETELASSVPETLEAETAKLVRSIAGQSGVALEQYMDFFTGRQFRRSLLVKATTPTNRAIAPARLAGLHFACSLQRDARAGEGGKVTYRRGNAVVAGPDGSLQRLLDYFEASYPTTRTVDEMLAHVVGAQNAGNSAAREALLTTLLTLLAKGQLEVSTVSASGGRASDRYPMVWPLARLEAAEGQDWLSTWRHVPVGNDAGMRVIVPLADGRHDRDSLRDAVRDALLSGAVRIKGYDAAAAEHRPQLASLADRILEQVLSRMERAGLLAGAG